MISLFTNVGSQSAIRSLSDSTSRLNDLIQQASTGKRVNSVRDDAASYTIAKNLESGLAGINARLDAINRASTVVDLSLVATDSISSGLIGLRKDAVGLASARLNNDEQGAEALLNNLGQGRSSINDIINSSDILGRNLLSGADHDLLAHPDFGSGVTVPAFDFNFGGPVITLAADGSPEFAVEDIDQSLDNVNAAQTRLSAASRSLEIQKEFNTKLSHVYEEGIGNIVDADLAEVSAEIQAEQVKQQLGITTLGIANRSPQTLLNLFDDA